MKLLWLIPLTALMTSQAKAEARMRAIGAVIPDGNQILTEPYPDFGSVEGQQAAQINMQEVVAKLAPSK